MSILRKQQGTRPYRAAHTTGGYGCHVNMAENGRLSAEQRRELVCNPPLPKRPAPTAPPPAIPASCQIGSVVRQQGPPANAGQPHIPPQSPVIQVKGGSLSGFTCVGDVGKLPNIRPKASKMSDYRPEFTVDRVDIDDLAVGAVSLRGFSHMDSGEPRQDAVAFKLSKDSKYVIAAIADGVSAAKLSHMGADYVTRLALQLAEHELAGLPEGASLSAAGWTAIAEELRTKLYGYAQRLEQQRKFSMTGNPSEAAYANVLGTTAELLVVKRQPTVSGAHEFIRVVISGDGSGYTHDPVEKWHVLSTGKDRSTEVTSNAVVPLPLKTEGYPIVQQGTIAKGQAVMAVTDGIGDMDIGTGNLASDFLHQRLSKPCSALELMNAFSFLRYQRDDDRTVVIVWVA